MSDHEPSLKMQMDPRCHSGEVTCQVFPLVLVLDFLTLTWVPRRAILQTRDLDIVPDALSYALNIALRGYVPRTMAGSLPVRHYQRYPLLVEVAVRANRARTFHYPPPPPLYPLCHQIVGTGHKGRRAQRSGQAAQANQLAMNRRRIPPTVYHPSHHLVRATLHYLVQ
jgi:hypothetical protein